MTGKRLWLIVALGLLSAALIFGWPRLDSGEAAPAGRRTIYMAAVEPKGGAPTASEPFPTAALPDGPGYVLKAPDATGRWEVSTYQWQPGFIVVYEREDVTLEILGINGAEHPASIEGINAPAFTVRRGQITRVDVRAPRPGSYRIVCSAHQPTMTGYLVVLPRR